MDTMADDVEAATEYLSDFDYVGAQCSAILGYLQVTYPWPLWMDMLMEMPDEQVHELAQQAVMSSGDSANSPRKAQASAPELALQSTPTQLVSAAEEAVPPKAGWVWKKGGSKHNAQNSGGSGGGLRAKAKKQATAKKNSWKKRWLQVNGNGVVVYLKDPKDILRGVEKGRLDLREYQVRGDLGNKEGFSSKEHGFSLVSPGREVFFGALSGRDKQEWLAYLCDVQQQVTGVNRKTTHANARSPGLAPFPMMIDLQLGASPSPDQSQSHLSPRSASPTSTTRRERVGWLYKKGGMSSHVLDPDELRRLFLKVTGSSAGRLDREQVGRLVSDAGMPLTDPELDHAMITLTSLDDGGGSTVSFQSFAAWWEQEHAAGSTPRATGHKLGLRGAKAKAKSIKQAHSHGRSNWKKRWFMVRGSCLVYYKSAEKATHMMGGTEKGRVELFRAHIRDNLGIHEASSSQNYGFSVISASGKEFYLGATSDHDKQEWLTYLESVIAATTAPRASPTAAGSTTKMQAQGWLLKKGGSKAHTDALANGTSGDGVEDNQELREMFDYYDDDKDGELCPAEVKRLARELGKVMSKHELEALFAELDEDGDGAVSFEEFAKWWHSNKDKKAGLAGSIAAKRAKLKGVAPTQSHHRWNRRWFIIDGFELVYYKDAESAVRRQKERGRISLASFTVLPILPEEDQTDKSAKGKSSSKAPSHFGFMLTDGQKNFKVAALTEVERYNWVGQLMRVIDDIWIAGQTAGLPGQLTCRGTTDVQLAEWKEASRDFTRAFVATGHGSGDMLLMGARQLKGGRGQGSRAGMEAMVCQTKSGGNVNEEVTSLAATEFETIIRAALSDACIELTTEAVTDLSRRVIGHLTVTPGMDVLVSNEVAPAMFQNKFVVLSGCGQVRVATYGFIGGPTVGDRPDRKATPFVLRMLSSNLLEGFGRDCVEYAVRRTAAPLMDEVMEEDLDRMVVAVSSGDYSDFLSLGGAEEGDTSTVSDRDHQQPASNATGIQASQARLTLGAGGDAAFADVAAMMERHGMEEQSESGGPRQDFEEDDQDTDEDVEATDAGSSWERMGSYDDDDDDYDSDYEDPTTVTALWQQQTVGYDTSVGGYCGGGGSGVPQDTDEHEDLIDDV